MKYPVGKNKDDYISNWYIASGFGEWRSDGSYYHEAIDLNLKTGGNSDLGQPIYAISTWQLVYFHYGTHPTTGFGKHYVYQIDGPWGTRWVHCAHNQDVIKTGGDSGSEGDQLSTLGNSGTTAAHLHFAIFKVDPMTLRNKIDTIAKTKDELNAWWESPVPFIEKWMDPPIDYKKMSEDLQKELDEKKIQVGNLQGQVTQLLKDAETRANELADVRGQLKLAMEKITSQNIIITEYAKDDAVQLEQLKSAEQNANKYAEQYFTFVRAVREKLKLSSTIDDIALAENEALEALQNLYQTNTYYQECNLERGILKERLAKIENWKDLSWVDRIRLVFS